MTLQQALKDYSKECEAQGVQEHFADRWHVARAYLEPSQTQYAVIYEDPDEPDAPVAILHPSPNAMSALKAGGIFPEVSSILADKDKPDDAPKLHPYATTCGPLSEEQAIEYLIFKDVPSRVLANQGNRQILRIVKRASIPSDRTYRNAWRLAQGDMTA
jgi:hypothetical protein